MKRVLIIDPSAPFALFLKIALSKLGYEVTLKKNGEEALHYLVTEKPELILSEAKLPGIGGIELCEKVKKEPGLAHIPIAIISIDGTMETKSCAQKAGCVDFLTKPITSRSLYELMERHLPFHYKRHYIRVNMSVKAVVSDDSTSREMSTFSVGEGGLYLCTDQPNPVGAKLTIKLPLPGLIAPLILQGEIVYINTTSEGGVPNGAGIKFIGMDENTVTLLTHYMMSYLSDFVPESGNSE
jgi:CheY-like chemotaxis protein